jgi:hypothetical protein
MLMHGFSRLGSHQFAWQHTRESKIIRACAPPVDELVWLTTATANATSWAHVDAGGAATAVDQIAGCKYWVVYRHKHLSPSSVQYFGPDWDPVLSSVEDFDVEGVVIRPGSLLCVVVL